MCICLSQFILIWESSSDAVANVMDCDIVMSKFELQSCYNVHFRSNTLREGMKPLIPQSIGKIVPILSFYKGGLALNNPRRLICYNTKRSNQFLPIYLSIYLINNKRKNEGVSSWCNDKSDGLQNRSKRVRTPVALLRSLSGKYPWESYEPSYPPSYGLNSTLILLLGEWLWH